MTAWPIGDGAGQRHPPDAAAHLAKPFANADFVGAVRRTLDEIDRRPRAGDVPTTRNPNSRPGSESTAGCDRVDDPGQS
jgi:hypothetical protein